MITYHNITKSHDIHTHRIHNAHDLQKHIETCVFETAKTIRNFTQHEKIDILKSLAKDCKTQDIYALYENYYKILQKLEEAYQNNNETRNRHTLEEYCRNVIITHTQHHR